MERSLAHIEKIEWIKDIPGADKIQVCGILGWECVIKKDEFKVGELVIYCEVDSIMPDKSEYEFLRERKFRVKIIKLKGQVSMGLVLPLSILDSYAKDKGGLRLIKSALQPGDDVTKYLEVTKYLSPSEQQELQQEENRIKLEKSRLKKFLMRYSWFRKFFLTKKQKSGFPYWISKTDEPRCISGSSVLNTDKGDFTIKEICESKKSFKVKSFNTETNEIEYKDIIGTGIMSNNNDWYEIELEDSTKVILTSEHPVYLPELNCYRQVKDLKSNNLVLLDK